MRTVIIAFIAVSAACTDGAPTDTSADTDDGADGGADAWDPDATIRENCFDEFGDDGASFPEYDQFGVTAGRHCNGTNHQDIDGVEKVVFLGDSVTVGTYPTLVEEYYRTLLTNSLQARFGEDIEIADCSEFGARTDDYLREQIPTCFPDIEDKRTLVIATMGGNDTFAAATEFAESGSIEAGAAVLERAIDYQREAMRWFRDNEDVQFPAGVFVITGNIYEYTDATGDMSSCALADTLGFGGDVPELREAYVAINEEFLEIAVETQTDSVFMLEQFCGHGFHAGEEGNECYRGSDATVWFDATCIHPNPEGHAALAKMFLDVVEE